MLPTAPIYIPSKGRWDTRLTIKALDRMQVPYLVVVESQEFSRYAAAIDPARLLVLDPAYQQAYDTCDALGSTKTKGSGPARNFIWDHAEAAGHPWHWVMDDNIRGFYRFHQNQIIQVWDGAIFTAMEAFSDRYVNLAMSGPAYEMFVFRRQQLAPFVLNTRIYSCNLIRTAVPFRWRGRYNEDTDLSLRMLKAGWCTVEFNAFLQKKVGTQRMRGGNTDDLYAEGTLAKSQMLTRLHPDVSRVVWKFNRVHHQIDYRPFQRNHLRLREGLNLEDLPSDNFGLQLRQVRAHKQTKG